MSGYRESGVYTLEELRAAEEHAERALSEAKRVVRSASQRERAADELFATARWLTGGCGVLALLAGASHITRAAIALGACLGVLVMLSLVTLVHSARRMIEREAAERDRRKAYAAWHRANERAACEASRISGHAGRCGCEQCMADPLGFYGPYRKAGAP